MNSRGRFGLQVGVVCSIALTLSACGWLGDLAEETKYRIDAVQDYVYQDDLDELWAGLREMASEYDCQLPEQPRVAHTSDCGTSQNRWTRVNPDPPGHQVEIDHERLVKVDEQGETREIGSRSFDDLLSWKLLQRRHPQYAKRIKEEARAAGEAAR